MSKMNNQEIRNMKNDDRAYGDFTDKKRVVLKDKNQKYRQNFSNMRVKDLINMNDDKDFDVEPEYETH